MSSDNEHFMHSCNPSSFNQFVKYILVGSVEHHWIKYSSPFDASLVGMMALSGFHFRADVQLWALTGRCVCGL